MKLIIKFFQIVILCFIYLTCRGQSSIEYQYIKYPNSQDLLIKWGYDEKFPIDCYSKCGIYRQCGDPQRSPTSLDVEAKIIYNLANNPPIEIEEDNEFLFELRRLERIAYPNPTNGEVINVKLNEEDSFSKITIFDALDQNYTISNWTRQLDVINIRPK